MSELEGNNKKMFVEIIFKDENGNVLATNGKAFYDEGTNYDEKVYELAQQAESEQSRREKEAEKDQYDPDYEAEVATSDYGRN